MIFLKKQEMADSRSKRGFSLIETLFYVSILVIFLIIIIESFISISVSYRRLKTADNIEASAAVSLERIIREIRAADSIDSQSVLDSSPGKLVLNSTSSGGAAEKIEFSIQDGKLSLLVNDLLIGPLTNTGVSVDNLVFRKINNGKAGGVKIEMELSGGSGATFKSLPFFTSAIIRGGE